MIMIDTHTQLAGIAATTRIAKADAEKQRKEQEDSLAGDILGSAADGVDVIGLAADGCKAAIKAVQPSHLTGGQQPVTGFTTGGGDGVLNGFQTVADCTPVGEAITESAGLIADAAGVVGDVVSGTVDIVGGILDGL